MRWRRRWLVLCIAPDWAVICEERYFREEAALKAAQAHKNARPSWVVKVHQR